MVSKERLIDAFGELINAVAFANGVVDDKEKQTLRETLENHLLKNG